MLTAHACCFFVLIFYFIAIDTVFGISIAPSVYFLYICFEFFFHQQILSFSDFWVQVAGDDTVLKIFGLFHSLPGYEWLSLYWHIVNVQFEIFRFRKVNFNVKRYTNHGTKLRSGFEEILILRGFTVLLFNFVCVCVYTRCGLILH